MVLSLPVSYFLYLNVTFNVCIKVNSSGELCELKEDLVKHKNRNKELEAALKEADEQNIKVLFFFLYY